VLVSALLGHALTYAAHRAWTDEEILECARLAREVHERKIQ